MSNRFAGRTALVVGAAGGMGAATVRRLAAEGAFVAAADLDPEGAAVLERDLGDERCKAYALDVRDPSAIDDVLADLAKGRRPVAHFVLASGIFRAAPFLDGDRASWDALFDVNLHGAIACLRAVAREMVERETGSIAVIASQSAKVVRLHQAAYGATKAALTYASKALGLEVAKAGVRVNVVQPGVTETPLALEVWSQVSNAKEAHIAGALERFRPPIPLQKVARSEDVAAAVAFLLSDDASHITMSEIVVDGGSSFIA